MHYKTVADLDEAIARLELIKAEQKTALQIQYHQSMKSLNPLNIIKHKFSEIKEDVMGPGETRSSILGFMGNLALSFLTKKLFIGKSNSKIKKLLGGLIETSSFGFLQSRADEIKAWATSIYHNIFEPKKDPSAYSSESK